MTHLDILRRARRTSTRRQASQSLSIALLKVLDRLYHKGEGLVSDRAYDRYRSVIQKRYPNNVYFRELSAPSQENYKQWVKLPVPMEGLTKIRPSSASTWLADKALSSKIIALATSKLDGISCLLYYADGIFEKAYSRGSKKGDQGIDITRHVSRIAPKVLGYNPDSLNFLKIPNPRNGDILIRAEIIVRHSVWKKFGNDFKNPRAMASALINRNEPSDLLKHLEVIGHGIAFPELADPLTEIDAFKCYGLKHPVYKVANEANDVSFYKSTIDQFKGQDYPCDGIVLSVANRSEGKTVSRVAVKLDTHDQPYAETVVSRVEWSLSERGIMNPRIHFKPVTLDGVTISVVTGNNAREIDTLQIGPGSTVRVVRAGDVIPHILKDKANLPVPSNSCKIPTKCPLCTSKLTYTRTANGAEGANLVCLDKSCSGTRQSKGFFSRLTPDGVGDAAIEELCDGNSVSQVLRMTPKVLQDHFGKVKGQTIHTSLHKSMQCSLAKIMYASGCFSEPTLSLGVASLSKILDQATKCGMNLSEFTDQKTSETRYVNRIRQVIPGSNSLEVFLGGLTAFRQFYATIANFHKPPTTNDDLKGMVICFTGFRDPVAVDEIQNSGGIYAASLSKAVNLMVYVSKTGDKYEKAKKAGIKCMSQQGFMEWLGLWKSKK